MSGIVSYGAYLPYYRLKRQAIGETLGAPSGRGSRSVASFDEDSTSMGVEAARAALASAPAGMDVDALFFSTTSPPYLDKTNANAIHAALDLREEAPAVDMGGSVRSGMGALRAALRGDGPTLAVLSDIRTGLPGSGDERDGGDGAVALLLGSGPLIAEYLGGASSTAEFLDRWRVPGDSHSRVWEERFGEHAYVPLAERALADACKRVGITPDAVDHAVVPGLHPRAARGVARAFPGEALADDLSGVVGNTGTAHPGQLLASVLDRAEPGKTIALVVLADGAEVLFFRTTERISEFRPRSTVEQLIATTSDDLAYPRFLSWRGMLRREPPRRPDPPAPAAPPSFRAEDWKFSFTGSRCEACGARHMPPQQVCAKCGAANQMRPERLADALGRIATYTVDRLAFSESPPVLFVVVDYEGGGRYRCEMTDVDPEAASIGDQVEMTFRRLYASGGVVNYFWKARPTRRES